MKNPDEAIERVLKGLREAEAPQGMERRILEAAQTRSLQARNWKSAVSSVLIGTHPWPLVTAGIFVVSVAASFTLHIRHQAEHKVASINAHGSPQTSGALDLRPEVAGTTRPARERAVLRSPGKSSVEKKEGIDDEDALAISEMRAPSHPAPPMPLTDQEKLLVRLIHKGDPVELAMLDPKFRSLEEANSKAEFDKFFSPTTTIDTKSPATVNQPTTGEVK